MCVCARARAHAHACSCTLSHFSHVRLFATLWTVACQTPLYMGFPRQEYWSGLPFPPPGDLPPSGIEPAPLTSPALAGRFLAASATLGSVVSAAQSRPALCNPMGCAHQASLPITNIATWKFPLKDFIQEGVQGISTKHVSKCLVRGDRFTLSGKLGERVAADV